MREKIGQEHLRIMHRDRDEVLSKTKTELLEVYAMQMDGRMVLDNKQINELTNSSASEEMSDIELFEDKKEDLLVLDGLEDELDLLVPEAAT